MSLFEMLFIFWIYISSHPMTLTIGLVPEDRESDRCVRETMMAAHHFDG